MRGSALFVFGHGSNLNTSPGIFSHEEAEQGPGLLIRSRHTAPIMGKVAPGLGQKVGSSYSVSSLLFFFFWQIFLLPLYSLSCTLESFILDYCLSVKLYCCTEGRKGHGLQ